MLTIVLGYKEHGNRAAPTVLYCGNDASAADGPSLAPPVGFVRTTLHKAPVAQRTRTFPENSEHAIAAAKAAEEAAAVRAEEEAAAAAKAEEEAAKKAAEEAAAAKAAEAAAAEAKQGAEAGGEGNLLPDTAGTVKDVKKK